MSFSQYRTMHYEIRNSTESMHVFFCFFWWVCLVRARILFFFRYIFWSVLTMYLKFLTSTFHIFFSLVFFVVAVHGCTFGVVRWLNLRLLLHLFKCINFISGMILCSLLLLAVLCDKPHNFFLFLNLYAFLMHSGIINNQIHYHNLLERENEFCLRSIFRLCSLNFQKHSVGCHPNDFSTFHSS